MIERFPIVVTYDIIKTSVYSFNIDTLRYQNDREYSYSILDTLYIKLNHIYKNTLIDSLKVGSIVKTYGISNVYWTTHTNSYPVQHTPKTVVGFNFSEQDSSILTGSNLNINYRTKNNEKPYQIIDKLTDSKNQKNVELLKIIERENIDSIKILIKDGALINSSHDYDYFGYHWTSPLFKAIETGNFQIFKTIIYSNADVFAMDRHGNNSLLWAAECGNYNALKFLDEHYVFNLDTCDIYGIYILEKAAGSPECLQYLIDKGTKINFINGQKFTPLEAAIDKKNAESIKTLLLNGADPNLSGQIFTPLQKVLYNDFDLSIIKLLINKGADVNARGYEGETAIFTALRYNKIEIVEYLISKGADIKMLDYKGNNVLMKLRSNGSKDIDKKIKLIQYILNYGIDINAVNFDGNSYLLLELEHSSDKNYDLIKKLIEFGADTKIKNKAGQGLKEIFEKNPFKEKPQLQELVNSLIE